MVMKREIEFRGDSFEYEFEISTCNGLMVYVDGAYFDTIKSIGYVSKENVVTKIEELIISWNAKILH